LLLARVIGTVVATRKEAELEGLKLLLLEGTDVDGAPEEWLRGSGRRGRGRRGRSGLYATGSSARQTVVTKDRPVDATVMAIVDQVEERGRVRYDKQSDLT